jgi:O-antigen biosynthesis protein
MLHISGFLAKIAAHLRLLREDPEKFGANLLQFTDSAKFLDRLLDVQTATPMYTRIDPAQVSRPSLNILQPVLSSVSMTGGPNTIITVAFHVAREGIPVRIITTRAKTDPAWFRQHLLAVTGASEYPPSLSVAFAGDANTPLPIGARDAFLATHWTTAQQIKPLLPHMTTKQFFYLIQDFEPGFHAWSSNYALALETYDLDFVPVINERLLFDFLASQSIGRFAEPDFCQHALVFEPAIDARVFHPPLGPGPARPRRLLFYARPTNARNLLGLGTAALRQAIANGAFAAEKWEFLAVGGRGSLPDLDLGGGHTLRPAPWRDYNGYADQLRESDILLCPMLSPHTSYPVLEMAACGGLVVTNTYASKTAARLSAISGNILAAKPTIEGLTEALTHAVGLTRAERPSAAPPNLPSDWDSALAPVTAAMARVFREMTEN